MSNELEFVFGVLGICVALYAALVALPTGRLTTGAIVILTFFLAFATVDFALEAPDPRYVDFGPVVRSVFAAALTGFSFGAALYHLLCRAKGHSWPLRIAGVPVSLASGTGFAALVATVAT